MRTTWLVCRSGLGSGRTADSSPRPTSTASNRRPGPASTRSAAWALGCRARQVAVDGSTICGMVTTGLCRDEDLSNFGELLAIYVDPAHVGTGVGRLLIAAARERLRRGFHTSCAVGAGRQRPRPAVLRTRRVGVRRDPPHPDVRQRAGARSALPAHCLAQGQPGQAGRAGQRAVDRERRQGAGLEIAGQIAHGEVGADE